MPNKGKKSRKPRVDSRMFTNTVEVRLDLDQNDKTFEFSPKQLLDLTSRTVVIKSATLKLMPEGSPQGNETSAVQLRWSGPLADADGTPVAFKPPRMISFVNQTTYGIATRLPYQTRPISSESDTAVLQIHLDKVDATGSVALHGFITTKVQVMPQTNFVKV